MMIGSFITRGLLLMFGYAYPAYECYKIVELNKPDVIELRFWCQYWILVAGMTVLERLGDTFISWVPMYGEAKVAFFIYLWFPKTKGTTYVYDSFFRPYLAKHETEIDRTLLELRTRVGDMVVVNWQKAAAYGQTRVFDILQYIASQSTEAQPRTPATGAKGPAVSENRISKEPLSHTSNSSSGERGATAEQPKVVASSKSGVSQHQHKITPTPSISETTEVSGAGYEQAVQIDSESSVPVDKSQSPLIIPEEAVQVSQTNPRQRRVNSGR